MAYLSPAYLQKYQLINLSDRRIALAETKSASTKASVFLAHSTVDDGAVNDVVLFFRDFDAHIYVDDYDKTLPNPPDTSTAQALKARITECGRFVVLVSANSRYSRWIPWEIGVADGKKDVANVAILPITQTGEEESWTKEEYFGLYPRIRLHSASNEWVVTDPRDGEYWSLRRWLHGSIG